MMKQSIGGRLFLRSTQLLLVLVPAILILLLCPACKQDPGNKNNQRNITTLDDRWKTFPYRDQNWDPSNEKFYFCEAWTWEYSNSMIAPGEFGHQGEFTMYLDPVTGTMLFTREDANLSDDMVDFVMAGGDQYYVGYTLEDGTKELTAFELGDTYNFSAEAKENFAELTSLTGKKKMFSEGQFALPMEGAEYVMSYLSSTDQNTLFLTEVPFNFATIYHLDKLSPDLRLPIQLDYSKSLPPNMLILSDRYESGAEVAEWKLKHVGNTEYHLDFTAYKRG